MNREMRKLYCYMLKWGAKVVSIETEGDVYYVNVETNIRHMTNGLRSYLRWRRSFKLKPREEYE